MPLTQAQIITRIGVGNTRRLAPTQPLYVVYLFSSVPFGLITVLYEGDSIRQARKTYEDYKGNTSTNDHGINRLILECKGRGVYRAYVIAATDL